MRIRLTKLCAFLLLITTVFLTWKIYKNLSFPLSVETSTVFKPPTKHITKLLTIVLRDFDLSENDVAGTVQSFLKLYPNIQILIVSNGHPYPPLKLNLQNETYRNVRFVDLSADFYSPNTFNPLNLIKTQYVLFVPDSTRVLHRQTILHLLNYKHDAKILAVPYTLTKNLTCWHVNVSLKEWTANFQISNKSCLAISNKHATLIELNTLYKLSNPFLMPHPHSLYLQTSVLGLQISIIPNVQFHDGKSIFYSHHSQRMKNKKERKLLKQLYEMYAVKKVIKGNQTENYGCTRDTPRCFGTIINYTPSYIYQNKTTPPCCLENLRKTAQHVFASLQESGVRFWLEGVSLLGAMKTGDIIPWDYDVDIGFNRDDLARCIWLKKAKSKSTVDTKGFIWEKATEGNFFKVFYSKVNRVYVNLLPFHHKNGTVCKDSWVSRVNVDFPDRFLHPMASIEFVGRNVPCPNNVRDFLEYKFSPDVVDSDSVPEFNTRFT